MAGASTEVMISSGRRLPTGRRFFFEPRGESTTGLYYSHVTDRVPLSAVVPQARHACRRREPFSNFSLGVSVRLHCANFLLTNSIDGFSKGSVLLSHPWSLTVSSFLDS